MDSKSMSYAVDKVLESGNNNVFITERGSMFGYQDLIVDFRNIPKMKVYAPVILDVTAHYKNQIKNLELQVDNQTY